MSTGGRVDDPRDAFDREAFGLDGRVAALTGGGSGIGKATALTLARAGASIVVADIDEAGAQATADEITEARGTASVVRTDVTDRADIDALVDTTMERHGRLDVMGNIAGVPYNNMVKDTPDVDLEKILAINLKGVWYGCQAAMRVMVPQGSGSIINLSSGAIDTPAPTLALYGMTKAAVAQLTKVLAMEAGRSGIRVNALAPGVIETNFSRQHFVDEEGEVDPERLEKYRKNFGRMAPLQRVGTPQDVANAIWWLVSDASGFVTGQIERPNGGVAMPW